MEELARLSVVLRRIESTEELRLRREQAAQKAAEAAASPSRVQAQAQAQVQAQVQAREAQAQARKGLSPETVALIDEAVLGKPRWPARTVTSVPVDPWNPAESLSISFNPGKSPKDTTSGASRRTP